MAYCDAMKMRGRVAGVSYLSAESLSTVTVVLTHRSPTLTSPRTLDAQLSKVCADGSFEFPSVRTGPYRIFVVAGATPLPPRPEELLSYELIIDGRDYSRQNCPAIGVDIIDKDINGIELKLPKVVFGRVTMENGGSLPVKNYDSSIQFDVEPRWYPDFQIEVRGYRKSNTSWAFPIDYWIDEMTPNLNGLFSLDSDHLLLKRDDTVRVRGLPPGYFVKSMSYGPIHVLKSKLKLDGPRTAEILITLAKSDRVSKRRLRS